MKPLLSILIPTVYGREDLFNRLISSFDKYRDKSFSSNGWYIQDLHKPIIASIRWNNEIEIIYCLDNKEITIGDKRERLYELAYGKYSIQIDEDDLLADNAIELILEAIKSNPEIPCITFRENCIMNGVYKSSNHSIKYEKWQDNFDGYDFIRCPFYKDVIKTEIAKSVPFPHIRYNEDEQWSMAIKPLLKNEIHIDQELYFYQYNPKESHEERYGIK